MTDTEDRPSWFVTLTASLGTVCIVTGLFVFAPAMGLITYADAMVLALVLGVALLVGGLVAWKRDAR